MKNLQALILGGVMFFLTSCGKDKTGTTTQGRVIVINEGGFHHGDASVSVYDPDKRSISNNVFLAQNGFALGDVAQCMSMIGDTAYIVMNFSKQIVIADASRNFSYLGHISMPDASPRYFLPVSSTKAYVTELYGQKIWIVDYRAGTVTGSIPVSGWTEQLLSYDGKVYVLEQTLPDGAPVHKVLMIDPATDQIDRSLDLPTDPGSMILTDDHKLFVLTSRQAAPVVAASLYQINPSSLMISKKWDFDSAQQPSYLRYSSFSHQLLFAMNGIYTMPQGDTILPGQVTITSDHWNVYGLGTDPDNGDIYISDAIDYQQASRIMRYSGSGTRIDAFSAGIITNGFVFR